MLTAIPTNLKLSIFLIQWLELTTLRASGPRNQGGEGNAKFSVFERISLLLLTDEFFVCLLGFSIVCHRSISHYLRIFSCRTVLLLANPAVFSRLLLRTKYYAEVSRYLASIALIC